MWTDKSKIVFIFGSKVSRQYVRRPTNSEYDPRFTLKSIKHGGSRIMIWGCFSYYGVDPIHLIRGIMEVYVDILENVMVPYAEDNMPLKWVFQQDNDPKHTSRKARQWFQDNKVEVMEWPAQSPDLNPIENLWADVKKAVSNSNLRNTNQIWGVVQSALISIPAERCEGLVESMKHRCEADIKNKGNATKN